MALRGGAADYDRQAAFLSRPRSVRRLAEVEGLLRLDDGQSCRETRLLAEQKLALIEQHIADLARMRHLLRGLITECKNGGRPRSCAIIATLSAVDERRDTHGIR